ncbi:peptide ABC transporter ATP-binding protein [Brevibacillus agri]|uniref:ABC transporter ATP-binding protein n=1 Tax=Brevibacillus agri TaxID=51101 RepID=A0A3M8B1K6_9BACL|nr:MULTISPECIES: ABC transporter ATP-binding protein [Brevibacillus]ELK40728.1 ABC transporter ATP-binding protein [Brevibacillus agri BAB-2500]EJL47162.1 oligopeptide/dipeptide ABC transporter, ATP-binding protein [Brevibacillus sp. CF112]MBG9565414.1 peptide ABC transporter ATP-binding protein [Brevibacillus agri]MBY0050257.1 ABC transporter ATP-binding protein [Brevibacillus agri]MCG5251140.1 ABC transporter ATP-binding protein [Brevibacillus agri]
MSDPVLQIENLQTHFFTDRGQIPAVDGVTITVNKGEVVGIVGESGCGKSVTSLSVMKLVPNPPGKIVGGKIKFKGEDLVTADEKRMRDIRGNEIAMIFQEPMTSLNPVFTIGNQIGEAVRLHTKASKKESRARAIDMLKKVGIPRAEAIVDEYPHQLSGGMRQRVMIAMAMACNPELLIADEPTTALDVTIQAQILDLMRQLNQEAQTAILLITHDLGVVAEMCHRVVVMYAGNVIEEGDVRTILKKPKHPYTKGLLNSLPKLEESQERLYSIPGNVPIPGSLTVGCRFAPRCDQATDLCRSEMPQLKAVGENHLSRCWLSE